ncbi:MAG: translocation/assembly module TamB domain-containing protein [Bacteroidales bacterium]|nr:translocation/assembly module TamB domain-containing protein [Bacteroidales bacterium]
MRVKIIKKKIIHSILILVTVAISIVTTLFVALQDPIIQRFVVRFAGGYLSEKTGAEIKVGRLVVTPDLRVFVREVSVKDLKGNTLAEIGALRTKILLTDLLEGKIHLGKIDLHNAEINLIQYEGTEDFNFKFLADFFSSDKEKLPDPNKKPIPIFVDVVSLKNVGFQLWDQNRADSLKTMQNQIDYAHLDLDDVNMEARHVALVGDSVYAVVEKLSAKERCGLDLKHFQSDVVFCDKGVFLKDLQMETNNSLFHLDLDMKYDSFAAFKDFVNQVEFDAKIYPTDALLSDIGYFAPVMFQMPNLVHLECVFHGPIANFNVKNLDLGFGDMTRIRGEVSMHPLDFENGYSTLNIKDMCFSYDDLVNFHIPGGSGTIPLPESLAALKSGNIKLNFKGSYNNFNSDIALVSDMGNLNASVRRDKQGVEANVFSGNIEGQGLDVGMFANTKLVGQLDLNTVFMLRFPRNGSPEVELDGNIYHAELLGNHIDEVTLNGEMKENQFKGRVDIDDDELYLAFNGLIDFSDAKQPKSDFEAVIRNADLHSLKIMKEDSVSVFSTRIYANMTGFDIDNLEGVLHLDSTVYRDSRGEYLMRSFDVRIVNDNLMHRRINLNNDFFDFEMGGKLNLSSLLMVFNEYGDSFVHFPVFEAKLDEFQNYKLKHDVEEDFFLQLTLKDTQTLSRLLMPSLRIAENTTVNGTFTSRSNQLNLTVRSQSVQIGNVNVNSLELRNFNTSNHAFGSLTLGEVSWKNMTDTDTVSYGLENLKFFAKMGNDTISTRIVWDDASVEDHNKALLESTFHPHETGGTFSIGTADIVINDTLWQIDPDNFIDIGKERVKIHNIKFGHNTQSLQLDGYVPMDVEDTLSVRLESFDLSILDVVTNGMGFDLNGYITGNAKVGNLKQSPMVLADLFVKDLGLNTNYIGDASIHSNWDNEKQAINVDMDVLNNNKQTLSVLGSYYTARENDNLDFLVDMDSLNLAIITPFVSNFINRVQGFAYGGIMVTGSPKVPVIMGAINIKDGGCKVVYLNTFYTFSPTISLDSKEIELLDMVLTDTLDNKATVEGRIYHNYLKNFRFDLKIHPRDFLVMATTLKDNSSFYGAVIANGLANVTGPMEDLLLDVKALTRKGTKLTLPLNRVSTVSENDFIVFVNNSVEEEEEEFLEEERKSNFAINIDADVTDDASVKIYLPGDIGTIDAAGNGNLKIGTSSSESLTLFGNFAISSGRFVLNFKNVLNRTFTLQHGGTIMWSGSPTEGRIDATGVYSVKAPLSSLGVAVDSTSSVDNVNVECLIHLKDALLNPTITFGMRLPNASEEVNQTVFSLIDTTNQAVMSSQAISLLALGSFAYAGSSSSGGGGAGLLSLFSNILPNMTLDLGTDVDVGVRYFSNSYLYDEMQIALKTELFENRLLVETNLGVISNYATNAGNASNVVGEFDIKYKLTEDGRLMGYFYNHSNYGNNFSTFAFDRLAPYTQGLGISYGLSFDRFSDLFRRKKPTMPGSPLINRPMNKEASQQ